MFSLLLMLACGGGEPEGSEPPSAPEAEVAEAAAPSPEPTPEPAQAAEASLPDLAVIGGISSEDIAEGLQSHQAAIDACTAMAKSRTPPLAGTVLLKFSIDKQGEVSKSKTHRSTLSDEGVEKCFNDVVLGATFPALSTGNVAIVHYPFVVSQG